MALQRLRNDPEAGWELRKRTPLWSPDFLMVSPDCIHRVAPSADGGLAGGPVQVASMVAGEPLESTFQKKTTKHSEPGGCGGLRTALRLLLLQKLARTLPTSFPRGVFAFTCVCRRAVRNTR